jgi:tetratricopeptide (TPR) repeat protein
VSDKMSRKELLKQQDAFLNVANQSALWVKGHRLMVFATVGAALVAVLAVWGVVEYGSARDLKASKLYAEALTVMDGQIAAAGAPADPSAKTPTFATKEEKWKAAREAFQKVVDASGGSGVSKLAAFYVADLDAKLGENDKALEAFAQLEKKLSADDNLFFLATERKAYLLEQKGDRDGAIAAWQQLLGGRNRFYGDHALVELARLYSDKGDAAKARELLTRFEKDHANSPLREQAEELFTAVGREAKPAGDAAKAPAAAPEKEKKATP